MSMEDELKNKKYTIPLKIDEYNPQLYAVGIDLGTTECCAAVIRRNGAEFVQLDPVVSTSRTLPSFVAYDEAHEKCGQIAVNRLRTKSKYIVFDSKRILGKQLKDIIKDPLWPFNVRETNGEIQLGLADMGIVKSPVEISAALLRHIKKSVNDFQGKVVNDVVITIPSTFTSKQTNATLAAAKTAGFENVHFIPEPVAAAFAYCVKRDIADGSKIFLFDCGGGTIDACVAEVVNDQINVLSYDGDPYLGGRDYDSLLFNYFHAVLKHNIDVMKSTKKYVLLQRCKEIKCTLSAVEKYWLDVNEYDPDNEEDTIPITRSDFEEMAEVYQNRITKIIYQAHDKSELEMSQINYVFQVGGGCRMPMIKQLLLDIFPTADHRCMIDPEIVVVHGAALYAYHLKSTENEQTLNKCDKDICDPVFSINPEANIVAIDFGLTYCKASVMRRNGPECVSLECTGERRLLPYVAYDEIEPKCGQSTAERMRSFANYTVYDLKQIIGKDYEEIVKDNSWPFKVIKINDKTVIEVHTARSKTDTKSPEEIVSVLLRYIKAKAEELQNTKLYEAVMTVPLNFSEKQKISLRKALVLAGWKKVHFIPEQTAAFAYFAKEELYNNCNILIFDCGGGTLDVCVAKVSNNQFKILYSNSDSYLGGKGFDNVLFTHFYFILKDKYGINLSRNGKKYLLKQKCQEIKCSLSFREESSIDIDDFDRENEELIRITRVEFEEMCFPLILRTKNVILQTVAGAHFSQNDINFVFQVGGGCRMPMIKKLLQDTFPTAQFPKVEYPEEVVVLGALYASNVKNNCDSNYHNDRFSKFKYLL